MVSVFSYRFIKVMNGHELIRIIDTDDGDYSMQLAEAVMGIVDMGDAATVSQMTDRELDDFR